MNQKRLVTWLFFVVAALSLIAAFIPLARGGPMNVVFLGTAVVFFVIGVATARRARDGRT
jgi:hypothetical protein